MHLSFFLRFWSCCISAQALLALHFYNHSFAFKLQYIT